MADNLVAVAIENSNLARDDRDERIGPIANPKERIAYRSGSLFAVLGQGRKLGARKDATERS